MNRMSCLRRTLALGWLASMLWAGALGAAAPETAFVKVSPRDPRYFELSDGRPYIPNGYDLVRAPMVEEFVSLLDTMAANKVNFCRVWLNDEPWHIGYPPSGGFDDARGAILRRFMDLAGERGIRVKMCLEEFRSIKPKKIADKDHAELHVANGGPFTTMTQFLETDQGHKLFLDKVAFYQRHVGDHPAVFAWELWNEMNCVQGDWFKWSTLMFPRLHQAFPRNLAVQSLGSFDRESARTTYRRLSEMPGNDVAQVHRYLDLRAALEVCKGPMDVLAADAVRELLAFKPGKPVLLAETGAVSPGHTGVSPLYAKDKEGTILHDVLFAPFFAGASGTGGIWFWRDSIEKPNQWRQFARFARATEGIDPAAEHFEPVMVAHPRLRVYLLKGGATLLAWCRDSKNDWRSELERGEAPELLSEVKIDFSEPLRGRSVKSARAYSPWTDSWSELKIQGDGTLALPPFQRSIVIKIEVK